MGSQVFGWPLEVFEFWGRIKQDVCILPFRKRRDVVSFAKEAGGFFVAKLLNVLFHVEAVFFAIVVTTVALLFLLG